MPISLNEDRIVSLVEDLPRSLLDKAPKTHVPIQLPLSFPSDLHHLNVLTILHLVFTVISQARHTSYLAETGSDALELALRGVIGLFLGSDEGWTDANLLSIICWKKGGMDNRKISEFFGIQTMREKNHPTLPVKIGESWKDGADLCEDLAGLFKRMGERLGMRCVGEAVSTALGYAEEEAKGQIGNRRSISFARTFCNKVIEFERSQADQHTQPEGAVLPAAPLRLLQDLSALLPLLPNLKICIPPPGDFSYISPLPLSLPLILHLGLVRPEGLSNIFDTLPQTLTIKEVLETSTTDEKGSTIAISGKLYAELQSASVRICQHIWGAARFTSGKGSGVDEDWKQELTFLDVERISSELDLMLKKRCDAARIVVAR